MKSKEPNNSLSLKSRIHKSDNYTCFMITQSGKYIHFSRDPHKVSFWPDSAVKSVKETAETKKDDSPHESFNCIIVIGHDENGVPQWNSGRPSAGESIIELDFDVLLKPVMMKVSEHFSVVVLESFTGKQPNFETIEQIKALRKYALQHHRALMDDFLVVFRGKIWSWKNHTLIS